MITDVPIHPPAVPRIAAGLKAGAARVGRAIWNALHAIGAARARAELIRIAAANETTHPELAAQLRRVVREDWLSQG